MPQNCNGAGGGWRGALAAAGLARPQVLLPGAGVDYGKWAVLACDQHTSRPEYWAEADRLVGDAPSALRMILPEALLGDGDGERERAAWAAMDSYLANGVFGAPRDAFVLVERRVGGGPARLGLLAALDLERYDYRPGASALCRATEATVAERLPPRARLRAGAALELPHALILVDDPRKLLFGPLERLARERPACYDFELMLGGGRVSGRLLDSDGDAVLVAGALGELLKEAGGGKTDGNRVGGGDVAGACDGRADGGGASAPMLYAVGDGNHSLAAAKTCWEALKAQLPARELEGRPARYAMAEFVDLRSEAIAFEPIHRALFGADPEDVLSALRRWFGARGFREVPFGMAGAAGAGRAGSAAADVPQGAFAFPAVWGDRAATFVVERPAAPLAVQELQEFLDGFASARPEATLDYIHGEGELMRLAREKGGFCFFLPPMDKGSLFDGVRRGGLLPRKAFSMGQAHEKRYYLEARRIRP